MQTGEHSEIGRYSTRPSADFSVEQLIANGTTPVQRCKVRRVCLRLAIENPPSATDIEGKQNKEPSMQDVCNDMEGDIALALAQATKPKKRPSMQEMNDDIEANLLLALAKLNK